MMAGVYQDNVMKVNKMSEKKILTEEMIYKLAERSYQNWDGDTIIDELTYLYQELTKHDKELREILIENYNTLKQDK